MDLLAQRVPQLLRALVPVGAQLLVLVRQALHESVPGVRQVQQMLNRSLRANFVAAELPEHLLLVIVRLNAPAKFVELERVKRHELRAGVTEQLALLPGNAHIQGHRGHGAEKETARTALAQRYIGMDGAVAKDACLYQPVGDKITIHFVRVVLGNNGDLVHLQVLSVLWRTAASACRRSWQLKDGRIATCIADHVEIGVAERTRNQLTFGIPVVEEQDDLALFKDWHDFIEELAGKRQFRGLAVTHDVANRHRDMADLRLSCVLAENRYSHRQADESMSIEIGLAIVFGVVVQDAYPVEVLAPLGNACVIHAEQDRLLPQRLRHYGKRSQRQGLANGCIRDEAVAKDTVIAVERCVRLLRQELPEQATHRRSRLQRKLSDEEPCQQMARRPRRIWEQGRKNRQESTNYRFLGV